MVFKPNNVYRKKYFSPDGYIYFDGVVEFKHVEKTIRAQTVFTCLEVFVGEPGFNNQVAVGKDWERLVANEDGHYEIIEMGTKEDNLEYYLWESQRKASML